MMQSDGDKPWLSSWDMAKGDDAVKREAMDDVVDLLDAEGFDARVLSYDPNGTSVTNGMVLELAVAIPTERFEHYQDGEE